ncbi:MAG: hypothetical protein P8Y70_18740 [Candidatus Lokiarchaeota archaeon]
MSYKRVKSKNYNYIFDPKTGFFERWGKNKNDNPFMCPFGPEMVDIKIFDGNGFMSLENFKLILSKLPQMVTKINLGVVPLYDNSPLKKILIYANNKMEYVPNITIKNQIVSDDWAEFLTDKCGVINIIHGDKELCYKAVHQLIKWDSNNVNIHKTVTQESFDSCLSLIEDVREDPHLEELNSVIFLSLKK